MTFRDWPRTLQRASWRGVSFFVEQDSIQTGRRLVTHEFPLADAPYIEDLGRDANRITVRAYVVSDQADSEEKALRAACERGGPGRLSLPMETLAAHCEKCTREFEKDRLGYVSFQLQFVREGTGASALGAALPAGFLASRIAALGVTARSSIAAGLVALVRVNGQPSHVIEAAVAQIQEIVASIDVLARQSPIDVGRAPALLTAIADLYADAEAAALIGDVPDRITRTSLIATASRAGSSSLPVRLGDILEALRLAVTPDVGVTIFDTLANYTTGGSGVSVPFVTPSRRRIGSNRLALDAMIRQLALVEWSAAAAARIYTDRRQAVQARADAGELFQAELAQIVPGTPHVVYASLVDLQAALVEFLSRRIVDMATVIEVSTASRMPSLWWSNRLYGTAGRARELVQRNRVIHASFMPETFEALAR